jgi:opacity protein-like surface antigen
MKTKTLLIAAVMFLGLTAAAFAQATYSVGSIPVTAVVNTGLVEKSGDITFSQTSGTVQTGTITISYGVQITNDTNTGIQITNIGGGTLPPEINKVDNAGGQVVLNFLWQYRKFFRADRRASCGGGYDSVESDREYLHNQQRHYSRPDQRYGDQLDSSWYCLDKDDDDWEDQFQYLVIYQSSHHH